MSLSETVPPQSSYLSVESAYLKFAADAGHHCKDAIMNLLIVLFLIGNLVKNYIFSTFTKACISLYSSSVMINH